MAIMIPETPHIFEPASQEGLMFDALTLLPDDYYVFHSFRISTVQDNTFHESETDFVIFHKKHGVICLEAKACLLYTSKLFNRKFEDKIRRKGTWIIRFSYCVLFY